MWVSLCRGVGGATIIHMYYMYIHHWTSIPTHWGYPCYCQVTDYLTWTSLVIGRTLNSTLESIHCSTIGALSGLPVLLHSSLLPDYDATNGPDWLSSGISLLVHHIHVSTVWLCWTILCQLIFMLSHNWNACMHTQYACSQYSDKMKTVKAHCLIEGWQYHTVCYV